MGRWRHRPHATDSVQAKRLEVGVLQYRPVHRTDRLGCESSPSSGPLGGVDSRRREERREGMFQSLATAEQLSVDDRNEGLTKQLTEVGAIRIRPGTIGHQRKQLSPVVQLMRWTCARNGFQWKPCTDAQPVNRRSSDKRTARSGTRTDSRFRHRYSSRRSDHASHDTISLKGKPCGGLKDLSSTVDPSRGEPKGKPGDEPERRKRVKESATRDRNVEAVWISRRQRTRKKQDEPVGETRPGSLWMARPVYEREPVHTRAEAIRRTINSAGRASIGSIPPEGKP